MTSKALGFAALFLLGSIVSIAAQSGETAVVSVAAPVRVVPDVKQAPLATLEPGVRLQILAVAGDWYRVSFRDLRWGDRVGYVRVEHVRIYAPDGSPNVSPPSPALVSPAAVGSLVPTATPKPDPPSVAPATAEPATKSPRPAPVVSSRSGGLSETAVANAIALGSKQRGRKQGLFLADSGQQWAAALTAGGTGATASNGFSVRAYTPLAWIRQLASDAAKEYRQFTINDVDEDATESVFRLIVFPDTPNTVTAQGMQGTSSVQHVVLRDESKQIVVQPTFKEPFSKRLPMRWAARLHFKEFKPCSRSMHCARSGGLAAIGSSLSR